MCRSVMGFQILSVSVIFSADNTRIPPLFFYMLHVLSVGFSVNECDVPPKIELCSKRRTACITGKQFRFRGLVGLLMKGLNEIL